MEQVKNQTVEEYMRMRYKIVLIPEEDGWGALIPELPGCMGSGDTIEEALMMLEDSRRGWLLSALDHGDPIPLPQRYESLPFGDEESWESIYAGFRQGFEEALKGQTVPLESLWEEKEADTLRQLIESAETEVEDTPPQES